MKLSGWVIILTCFVLGLSVACYAFFQIYQPYEEAAANNLAYKAQLETEANKQKSAEKRVEQAMGLVTSAAGKWNEVVATYTPSNSLANNGINVNENPYQLVVDSPKYRNSAQRAFNAQLHQGGVKVVAAPEIPLPTDSEKEILLTYYNYPAFNFPVVLWELGSVTVQGTYAQIVANVRAWSRMPHYLAVADGLRIDGTSPNLTGNYNVTIVGYINAPAVYPPPPGMAVEAAPAGGLQGGGPGGPGGAGPRSPKGGGGLPAPGPAIRP